MRILTFASAAALACAIGTSVPAQTLQYQGLAGGWLNQQDAKVLDCYAGAARLMLNVASATAGGGAVDFDRDNMIKRLVHFDQCEAQAAFYSSLFKMDDAVITDREKNLAATAIGMVLAGYEPPSAAPVQMYQEPRHLDGTPMTWQRY